MNAPLYPDISIPEASRDELVGLIGHLLERQSDLENLVQQLRAENTALKDRVRELQGQLNKDSHNSSKPPSSDGLAKKPSPKSLRLPGSKPSGGQPGHPGSTLTMSETPDYVIVHAPALCTGCGASLEEATSIGYKRRQVFDLPPLSLQVMEHRAQRRVCARCGMVHQGDFPASVNEPVQYGERIKAVTVYLSNWQLLPWDRTTQLLTDLFGCSLGEGVLQSAQQRCEQVLAPITEQIKEALERASLAHFDETGQRIAGKLHWLHVAATDTLTYYATHAKRGHIATDEIGILPVFGGRAIHDAYSSYLYYSCKHGLCNAHHLRELTFLAEEHGQIWAQEMKTLLVEIKNQVDHAKEQGLSALPAPTIHAFEERYDRLIENGYSANPEATRSSKPGRIQQSKGRNLVARLRDWRAETLAFMHDFSVPFDNNLAERDIRMMKVRQKVSGCFRTIQGAKTFGCIRGYLSTMQKQGHNALAILEILFQGQPRAPSFA